MNLYNNGGIMIFYHSYLASLLVVLLCKNIKQKCNYQ